MDQEATVETPTAGPGTDRSARVAALRAEVATLEAELERRERQHEQVVERYEALLDEQTRAHRETEEFVWTGPPDEQDGLLASLRSLF
jgi:outer membrane murein-binding lipoprotein Lpp